MPKAVLQFCTGDLGLGDFPSELAKVRPPSNDTESALAGLIALGVPVPRMLSPTFPESQLVWCTLCPGLPAGGDQVILGRVQDILQDSLKNEVLASTSFSAVPITSKTAGIRSHHSNVSMVCRADE